MTVNSTYKEKIEYAESIKSSYPQKAFDIASKLYVQNKEELNASQQLRLKYLIGSARWKLGEYESALIDAVEMIDLAVNQNELTYELKAYNLLGLVYSDLDNLDVALEYFNLSLNLSRANSRQKDESMSLNNIGGIYNALESYEKALSYYQECYQICMLINDKAGLAIASYNIGDSFAKLGEVENALTYIQDAWELFKSQSDEDGLSYCHNVYGEIYHKNHEYEKAIDRYSLALSITKKTGNRYLQIEVLRNMTELILEMKDFDLALDHALEALDISRQLQAIKQQSRIENLLSHIYEAKDDYPSALEYNRRCLNNHLVDEKENREKQIKGVTIQLKMEHDRKEKNLFKEKNIELEKMNKRLEEMFQDMKTIGSIGRDITAQLDLKIILRIIYDSIKNLMNTTSFGIVLYDSETKMLDTKLFLENGLPIEMENLSIDTENSLVAWCVRNKSIVLMNDIHNEYHKYLKGNLRSFEFAPSLSAIFCPLMVGSDIVGVLTVQSKQLNSYSQYHVDTLVALSAYVAIAIKNSEESYMLQKEIKDRKKMQDHMALLNEQLEKMSYIDELTGIPNRRQFTDFLNFELGRAKRTKDSISVLIIDIDNFKEFNDNYGHIAGDVCITQVADKLKSSLKRKTDFVARYGGDEFVVVLPNTSEEGARKIAIGMLNCITTANIQHEYVTLGRVSITLGGVCLVPDQNQSIDTILNLADKALYEAKEKGRNCVNFYNK